MRMFLSLAARGGAAPTAAMTDGRTFESTPESGKRAVYDGAKRREDSKAHLVMRIKSLHEVLV